MDRVTFLAEKVRERISQDPNFAWKWSQGGPLRVLAICDVIEAHEDEWGDEITDQEFGLVIQSV